MLPPNTVCLFFQVHSLFPTLTLHNPIYHCCGVAVFFSFLACCLHSLWHLLLERPLKIWRFYIRNSWCDLLLFKVYSSRCPVYPSQKVHIGLGFALGRSHTFYWSACWVCVHRASMDSIDLHIEYMCTGLWNILCLVDLSYFSPLSLL